jgi:hypothetical protein
MQQGETLTVNLLRETGFVHNKRPDQIPSAQQMLEYSTISNTTQALRFASPPVRHPPQQPLETTNMWYFNLCMQSVTKKVSTYRSPTAYGFKEVTLIQLEMGLRLHGTRTWRQQVPTPPKRCTYFSNYLTSYLNMQNYS